MTRILIISFFFGACAESKVSPSMTLSPTVYFKPTIKEKQEKCDEKLRRELVSVDGRVLTTLCESDYRECLMQGSCFVEDGKKTISYNFHSKKNGVPRFIIIDTKKCPFGYGVANVCLDPYFSVAADLKHYRSGDVIFVPRLVGANLPNGEVHDGFLIIRDSGGGVVGSKRFDFFTGSQGLKSKENVFVKLGFADPANLFSFRMATADEAELVRKSRNYPGIARPTVQPKPSAFTGCL